MGKTDEDFKVTHFFQNLGLSLEEARLYLGLVKTGAVTILQLSRLAQISRTQVYRLTERLQKRGLVEEIVREHRRLVKAVDIHGLEMLLQEEEARVSLLKRSFSEVISFFQTQPLQAVPDTKVTYYRGVEGIKQLVWATLKAKKEVVGYTYWEISTAVGMKFAVEWKEEFIRWGLFMRDIYSDDYLQSLKTLPKDYVASWPKQNSESRYLAPKLLNVDHQVDIYNDVLAYYSWHEGEIFGVEIRNAKIAALQKQLFELAWKQGTTETKLARQHGQIFKDL